MTNEERRAYLREWRHSNPDKVKAQRQRHETKLALAALENVERITDDVCVVKTISGQEFTIFRKKG